MLRKFLWEIFLIGPGEAAFFFSLPFAFHLLLTSKILVTFNFSC